MVTVSSVESSESSAHSVTATGILTFLMIYDNTIRCLQKLPFVSHSSAATKYIFPILLFYSAKVTLANSSVAVPTISTTPTSSTTHEINGATTVTLACTSTTPGVTYQWTVDGSDM